MLHCLRPSQPAIADNLRSHRLPFQDMFLPAAFILSKIEKKEQRLLQQLVAAQRRTFGLHEHIITIDRLVNRVYSDIEVNKWFIRSGLSFCRGKDMHSIMEVSRQLKRNHIYFENQLTDLDENLCISSAIINHARSHLIQVIKLHPVHRQSSWKLKSLTEPNQTLLI